MDDVGVDDSTIWAEDVDEIGLGCSEGKVTDVDRFAVCDRAGIASASCCGVIVGWKVAFSWFNAACKLYSVWGAVGEDTLEVC